MRVSKLRIYVLKQFDEKKELNNAEIAKLVENEFGKESYSKKQLINLLYNLTKAGVISRKSKGVFCKNVHLEENKVDDDINSFIKHYINGLDVLSKEFAKKMNGYGFRVQKSAFEAMITEKLYGELIDCIPKLIDKTTDSVRIYKIRGQAEVSLFGIGPIIEDEEIVII